MNPFVFNTTARIAARSGAAGQLAQLAGDSLGESVLFVTDGGIRAVGLERSALASLQDAGLNVAVFDDVEPDPSLETVMKAVAVAQEQAVSGVVALGGGSVMDVAKLVALLSGSGEEIDTAWGVNNARGPRLPLALIPTTAGTGSEVTPVSIVTLESEEKRGVSSPVLLPDIAILDAELTLGLPSRTTAATGIDAMVHAIEAYTSKSVNNNHLSRILSVKALQLLGANIETAAFEPDNLEARENMLVGSCLAGMAFANSPVAAVHALAYPIGGSFHVPHGLSNALMLSEVLRFNAADPANGSYRRYAELGSHAFKQLPAERGAQEQCAAFIENLEALSARLDLPGRLRDVEIPESALPKLAEDAMKQTRLLVNNPRELTRSDALAIYQAVW